MASPRLSEIHQIIKEWPRPFVSSGGRLAHILLSREAVNMRLPLQVCVLNRNTVCVCDCVCSNYVRTLPSGWGTLGSLVIGSENNMLDIEGTIFTI